MAREDLEEYLRIDMEVRAIEKSMRTVTDISPQLDEWWDRADGPWHRMTDDEQAEARREMSRRNREERRGYVRWR